MLVCHNAKESRRKLFPRGIMVELLEIIADPLMSNFVLRIEVNSSSSV